MDRAMARSLGAVVVWAIAATALAALGWGVRAALSVGVGGLFAVSNLWALARVVGPLLLGSEAGGGAAARYGVLAAMKMVVLFGGMWLLMARGLVTPLGLLAGYAALPLGIATGSLLPAKS